MNPYEPTEQQVDRALRLYYDQTAWPHPRDAMRHVLSEVVNHELGRWLRFELVDDPGVLIEVSAEF